MSTMKFFYLITQSMMPLLLLCIQTILKLKNLLNLLIKFINNFRYSNLNNFISLFTNTFFVKFNLILQFTFNIINQFTYVQLIQSLLNNALNWFSCSRLCFTFFTFLLNSWPTIIRNLRSALRRRNHRLPI